MSQIGLEILIGLGRTGASMTHAIQIQELPRIHVSHGNRAIVSSVLRQPEIIKRSNYFSSVISFVKNLPYSDLT